MLEEGQLLDNSPTSSYISTSIRSGAERFPATEPESATVLRGLTALDVREGIPK